MLFDEVFMNLPSKFICNLLKSVKIKFSSLETRIFSGFTLLWVI